MWDEQIGASHDPAASRTAPPTSSSSSSSMHASSLLADNLLAISSSCKSRTEPPSEARPKAYLAHSTAASLRMSSRETVPKANDNPATGVLEGSELLEQIVQGEDLNERGTSSEQPDHLLLMVNGLFGSTENWLVVQRNLAKLQQASKVLMVASNANLKLQTFDGIDNCGKRLAQELQECIKQNPGLVHISVIGHSMGGLIARYTLGVLFDPASGLIAGLVPRHFISLATPHLGCGGEGPAQVPFIGWTEEFPLVGSYATRALQYWANAFASIVLRRTGEQFFLLDSASPAEPLLVQMVEDTKDGHFFSALQAFKSRTCYANSSGDHIVGWANSSVRHPDELPDLGDVRQAKGVVRGDDVAAALSMNGSLCHAADTEAHIANEPTPCDNEQRSMSGTLAASPTAREANLQQAESAFESSAAVLRILRRLQELPWCRVDTSFRGTTFPYFAHNLIQVTREWLNWEGENVVQHLAQHFSGLEDALDGRNAHREAA